MKKRFTSTILVLVILLWGCAKEEVINLETQTETEEKVDETSVSEESEETETSEGDNEEETTEETDGEESSEETTTEETQAPAEVEESSEQQFGLVSYRGRIPTESSKVPSCKAGSPDTVIFRLVDATGVSREEKVPAEENNGLVTTLTPASLPIGQTTINEILLMNGNDTLYAIPSETDFDLARYADATVPFEVEVAENTELTGSAFCYTQVTIDVPDEELVDGGFGTQRLQTLWIDVQGECIDILTVTIDAYRVLEIYPFQDGLYDIPIPENYSRMDIRAYTPEFQSGANDFKVVTFTASEPYNADGVLNTQDLVSFSYDCPPEEFPDDDF